MTALFVLIFGPSYIPEPKHSSELKRVIMTIYESVFKIIYACCLCFIVYACTISKGGDS